MSEQMSEWTQLLRFNNLQRVCLLPRISLNPSQSAYVLSDPHRRKPGEIGREWPNDSWGIKSTFAWDTGMRPGSWWHRNRTWRSNSPFTLVRHFQPQLRPGPPWRPAPKSVEWWGAGSPCHLPSAKALFGNPRGGLVVKGDSSTFLSFLFSEPTFKCSASQSCCRPRGLGLRALNIYRPLRIPSVKLR